MTDTATIDNAANPPEPASVTSAGSAEFVAKMLRIGGGLCAAAIVIGAFQTPSPWGTGSLGATEWMLGLLGGLPLFLVIYSSAHFNDFVTGKVAPLLAPLATGRILGLAVLLAFGEELFFRGLLPSLMKGFGPMWALVLSNIIYGACYAVNRGAWITMFLFGCYLSALMASGDNSNIVRPILAHIVFYIILLPALAKSARTQA